MGFHYRHHFQLSRDPDDDLGEDQTWTEFDSIEHNQLYCFFCDAVFNNLKELGNHLYSEHDFEFDKIKGKYKAHALHGMQDGTVLVLGCRAW